MKKLKNIILRVLALIAVVILTVGIFIIIQFLQDTLLIPNDYIIWIFKSPYSGLVIIYEIYLMGVFFFLFNNEIRNVVRKGILFKKVSKTFSHYFYPFQSVLLYTIMINVAVITKTKIINYSFFSPQGREYRYNDIEKIQTGVYGKGHASPFRHSKGDFYYIIELNDGAKIDLTDVGGTRHDIDERFIIEKLDKQFVNMDIPKSSSMKNFDYAKKHLAKIYTDKMKSIIKNTK